MKSGTPAFFAAVAMAFLFVGTATAQDDPATVERTARAYLAAYESVDVERMMELAAEDIVFRDDSAPAGSSGGPYVFEGRDAWLSAVEGFVSENGLIDLHQRHDFAYQSGAQMVFVGSVDARYRAPAGGVSHFRSRIITVLTVQDGRVSRHLDIADYPGALMEVVPTEVPAKISRDNIKPDWDTS